MEREQAGVHLGPQGSVRSQGAGGRKALLDFAPKTDWGRARGKVHRRSQEFLPAVQAPSCIALALPGKGTDMSPMVCLDDRKDPAEGVPPGSREEALM